VVQRKTSETARAGCV